MSDYKLRTTLNKNFKPIKFRSEGKPHFQIFLEITSETDSKLDNIKKVEYILHPSFKDRIRSSFEKETNFKVEIKAWGTFVVKIRLFKTDGSLEEFEQNMKDGWVSKPLFD